MREARPVITCGPSFPNHLPIERTGRPRRLEAARPPVRHAVLEDRPAAAPGFTRMSTPKESRMRRAIVLLVTVLSLSAAVVVIPRAGAQAPATITVDVAAGRRPIDPRIYGVNFADRPQLQALNVPL